MDGRHAETAANAHKLVQGSIDFPLNEAGLSQAKQMGRALAHLPLDVIVSSDTIRTQETAATVAEYHPSLGPVQLLAGLHEMCFGELEGQRIEDVKTSDIFDEVEAAWSGGDAHRQWPGHGGESPTSVAKRSLTALQTLLDPPASVGSTGASVCPQRLMLVGHDRLNRILLASLLYGEPARHIEFEEVPLGLSVLDRAVPKGRSTEFAGLSPAPGETSVWKLMLLNNTDFLESTATSKRSLSERKAGG